MINYQFLPESPFIFLNQEFIIQLNITNVNENIKWLSAQIHGKIKSLKKEVDPLLQDVVSKALGGSQQAPYFGHVMSGSRLIKTDLNSSSTFCLKIKANEIPPTYHGIGIDITYELRISSNIGNQIISTNLPIYFIGSFNNFTDLTKVQSNAEFSIESLEVFSNPSPFSLICPYHLPLNRPIESFQISNNNEVISTITLKLILSSGNDFNGLIDLTNSSISLKKCEIFIYLIENYNNFLQESKIILSNLINLEGFISKRFSILLPFNISSTFSNSIFSISYKVEFKFYSNNLIWNWSSPITILPPEILLSTSRTLS